MKKNKFAPLLLIAMISALPLTLTGCANQPPANVAQTESAAKGELPNYSKTYSLNQVVNMNPIKVRLDSVSLVRNSTDTQNELKGHIAIGLEIGNMSSKNVRFYPEQFVVTADTGEQLLVDTSYTGESTNVVGGLLPPQRVLQGYVMFPLETTNPDDLKEIKLKIAAPQDEKGQPLCNDQELVIPIQQA